MAAASAYSLERTDTTVAPTGPQMARGSSSTRTGKIWMASVPDGDLRRIPIMTPQGVPVAPIWSPSGRWIAVTGYDAHTINGSSTSPVCGWCVPMARAVDPSKEGSPTSTIRSWKRAGRPADARSRSSAGKGWEHRELGIIDVLTGKVVYISAARRVLDLSWSAEDFILASVAETASPSPPISGVTTAPSRDPWPGIG